METWIAQVRVVVAVEMERNRPGCFFAGIDSKSQGVESKCQE